ncbi:hypothetical protein GCM10012275_22140 [Longimycelium tulufanense]|uniref:O-antigen ligase-related domain-containing protein n=1 Tax=Longimycelium tulufanense TaxID=907463 RepID=A0A8J3CF00_9PSEU|nr:O-antigen ligase family protein [Longimycelium tulufanense]GGM50846.1 hypothetical protein GCM10012275_22140 [Longimycelium tulufanense]
MTVTALDRPEPVARLRLRVPPQAVLAVLAVSLMLPQTLVVAGIGASVTPARLMTGVCLLLWLAARTGGGLGLRAGPNPVRGTVLLVLLGLGVAHALALISGVPDVRLAPSDTAAMLFLLCCGATLLAADGLADLAALRVVLGALVVGGTLSALAAILQFAASVDIRKALVLPGLTLQSVGPIDLDRGGLVRSLGFANHPIELAAVSAAVIPLALHLAQFGRWRLWWLSCAGILAGGVLVSISRTGIVALAVIALSLALRQGLTRWAIGMTAAGILGLLSLGNAGQLTEVLSETVTGASKDNAVLHRVAVWDYVAERIGEHPIAGQGYGTYSPPEQPFLDNQYLLTTVESGLVGALVLAMLLLVPISVAFRVWRAGTTAVPRRERLAARDAGWAIGTALLVCAVSFATFDALAFPQMRTFFLLLVGVAGALAALARPRSSPDEEVPS